MTLYRQIVTKLKHLIKLSMASAPETQAGEKRPVETVVDEICKKQKVDETNADRKRKVALMVGYNGKGYYGLQLNPGFPTIESEILKAVLAVGVIPQNHHDTPQKMSFQRASRTDKGVSAAGNVVSLKLNVDNLVEKINENLPPTIRLFEYVRTTKGFDSKNHCSSRTYVYLLPTYAFCPVEELATLAYRTNLDEIERVNEVLEKFVGTHNFHNFTSGIKPNENCAKRYIQNFECRMPFVRDGVEFCVLSVKGNSFMLHQIRKMIGLTIAIVRGYTNIDTIDEAWKHEKVDIPKAPGLGLVLEKLHYDVYNKRYAADGSRDPIDFNHLKEKMDKFKEDYIFSGIIKDEVETQSMMEWMKTLHYHSYSNECSSWSKRKGMNKFQPMTLLAYILLHQSLLSKFLREGGQPERSAESSSDGVSETVSTKQDGNTEVTSQDENTEVTSQDGNTEVTSQDEKSEVTSQDGNTEVTSQDENIEVTSQVDSDSNKIENETENEPKESDEKSEMKAGASG